MSLVHALDDALLRRLPLPLAQLYLRAHNAKTPIERHLAAYYLWEAALKLLASAAIVTYADLGRPDPQIAERLRSLARPALGHWWEFVRLLVPALAEAGDDGFRAARDLLLGPGRSDLPRAAGLDACLREALDGRAEPRGAVRLGELFDRLVRYRNRELGHGAAGQAPQAQYERVGAGLLLGVAELLGRLDVLAGRRLVHVADVRRQVSGDWLVEPYELTGETARRLPSWTVPAAEAPRLPHPERVYLQSPGGDGQGTLCSLHPLVTFDLSAAAVFFLNSRRGARRCEYLCYTTGEHRERDDAGAEQRELLVRALGRPVGPDEIDPGAISPQPEEPTSPAAAEEARRRVGEFELLSELGRGGMGVVYRAWQPSLGRQVALKCLLRAGDPKAEARFAREIHALGRVEHPNVVKVFTSGVDGERWYYAMELVEGADLGAVCERLAGSTAAAVTEADWRGAISTACEAARKKEKPLSDDGSCPARTAAGTAPPPELTARGGRAYVAQVVEVVRQVAEAAHTLHEAGVVHRDVKPGNILLTPDGDHAVLMDLGLAQLADETEGRLTRTRQFVGTLRYASPEQVLAIDRLDRRTDVYSLGATLWELLTLRPIYGATDATPTGELMQRIQRTEPERPRRHNPRVPPDLEAVVLKSLEKNQAARYATARELAEDLGRWQRGEPVLARPVGEAERAWRWCRRNPVVSSLLAAVAAALLVGSIVATYFAVEAGRRAAEAEAAHQDAEEARLAAEAKARGEAEAHAAAELARQDAEAARGRAAERARTEAAAKDEAERARKEADGQRKEALSARGRAEAALAEARANLYLSGMALAQRQLSARDIAGAKEALARCPEELRGWEWGVMGRCCDGSLLTLRGHQGTVYDVAFSPDGKRLVTAGHDRTARVWNAATGQEQLTFRGHDDWVRCVAFSPAGDLVASGAYDGTLKLWRPATGDEVRTLPRQRGPVRHVAFSPDGKRLAAATEPAGGDAGTITVCDLATGDEALSLKGERCVAFSPDGKRLAGGGADLAVVVWDAATGHELRRLRGHTSPVLDVAFAPDGWRLAAAAGLTAAADFKARLTTIGTRVVKFWDTTSGREISFGTADRYAGRCVAFAPGGATFATGGTPTGVVSVCEGRSYNPAYTLVGHTGEVVALAYSPDGERLATAAEDGTARVWDAGRNSWHRILRTYGTGVASARFSPDGKLLAASSAAGSVRVWDLAKGRVLFTHGGEGGQALAFSPDGKRLAGRDGGGHIRAWDAESGRELGRFERHPGAQGCLAFSPDGKEVVSAAGELFAPVEVRAYDAATGERKRTAPGGPRAIFSVALSPDGRLLVGVDEGGAVKVWDAATGKPLRPLEQHPPGFLVGDFGADGKQFVSGGTPPLMTHVGVWDVATGKLLRTLPSPTLGPQALSFSPDGQRLVSGGHDHEAKVWDAAGGQLLATCRGHTLSVGEVRLSPDGKLVCTGSQDNTLRLWDAATGAPRAVLTVDQFDVSTLAFYPDGQRVAAADVDHTVGVWDAARGTKLLTMKGNAAAVAAVALSPKGDRLATGTGDWGQPGLPGELRVFDARTGDELHCCKGHQGAVLDVAFGPGGRLLASAGADQTVRLWDPATGAARETLRGHTGPVVKVAFAGDTGRLVSAAFDKTARVWDAQTGKPVHTLRHDRAPFDLAIRPDGRQAVTATFEDSGAMLGTLHFWDLIGGREERHFVAHSGAVLSVAYTPDGGRLVTAGFDGSLRVWDVATGHELLAYTEYPRSVMRVAFGPDGRRVAWMDTFGTIGVLDAAPDWRPPPRAP
jgi:WD40 repeat protein/serine/threonine protein kinase